MSSTKESIILSLTTTEAEAAQRIAHKLAAKVEEARPSAEVVVRFGDGEMAELPTHILAVLIRLLENAGREGTLAFTVDNDRAPYDNGYDDETARLRYARTLVEDAINNRRHESSDAARRTRKEALDAMTALDQEMGLQ